MNDAERWFEISEVMSFDVQLVEVATLKGAEIKTEEDVAEPEVIVAHEPRVARVVSITELRQKLGIEEVAFTRSAPAPMTGRPKIVSRRREAEEYAELAAG